MSEAEQRDLYEPAGYVIRGTLLARHALDLRRPSLRWMKPILQALEKYAAHFQTSIVYAWTHRWLARIDAWIEQHRSLNVCDVSLESFFMREVSHTIVISHRFSWQSVTDRAGRATRETTPSECRNIEGYLP